MRAKIIYNKDVQFELEIPKHITKTVDILRYLWNATNPGSGSTVLEDLGLRVRSSMVGDVYIFDEKNYFVDGFGFVEITDKSVKALMDTPDPFNRMIGWEFAQERMPELDKAIRRIDA